MAVVITKPGGVGANRPLRAFPQQRKVALLGSYSKTLPFAPWDDPSWELWGHATARGWYPRELDVYFDLHPQHRWSRKGYKRATTAYYRWLTQINTRPIFMQRKFPEVPGSVKFPKDRILQEYGFPRPYFTNHVAWMIAFLLQAGSVTHIGLWGINYSNDVEHLGQRGCCEYWLGRAAQAGIQIVLPPMCSLLEKPKELYGYESHETEDGELIDSYRREPSVPENPMKKIEMVTPENPGVLAKFPEYVQEHFETEDAMMPRPSWSLAPL